MSDTDQEQTDQEDLGGRVFDEDAYQQYLQDHSVPAGTSFENFVDWNTKYLKDMAEGDGASYWQWGPLTLLIGESNREAGEFLMTRTDSGAAWEGTITMAERGGTFSAGKVNVTGCQNEGAFKSLFGQLSKKTVKFN